MTLLSYLKRWRFVIIALVAAFAVSIATGTEAFANEPGESNQWNAELTGGGSLQSLDTISQARSPSGTLVDIWRGWSDNRVWISVNNGAPLTIADLNTTTFVAPRIVYSNGYFYAFHTGSAGQIFWSRAMNPGDPDSWTQWFEISGQTTDQSVSVASSSAGILMVYRGSNNDTRMFSTWLPVGSGNWEDIEAIGGGAPIYQSNSAPVVTFNPQDSVFWVVYRGFTDDRVYLTGQNFGASSWFTPVIMTSIQTDSSPVIAALPSGDMMVAARDYNGNLWNQAIDRFHSFHGWQPESQGWQTNFSPFLSVASGVIYMIVTSLRQGQVYWKQDYQP